MWDQPAVRGCAECGTAPVPGARFCQACGTPVAAAEDEPRVTDNITENLTTPYGFPAGYQPYDPGRRRRPRPAVVIGSVIALALAVAAVTATVLATRHSPAPSPPPASAPSASATGTAQRQALMRLGALLAVSATDRTAADRAYQQVLTCVPDLSGAQSAFQQAATSQQQLVSRLASMPGASALPVPMATLLSQAWQQSATSDQDFAAWATDENSGGSCTPDDTADTSLEDGGAIQIAAGDLKTLFLRQWNPLAGQNGLRTYQPGQI